ncbi:MAG: MBL fold metallo-hydrolase [Candidatus Bathyarchaeota archaeon]|jgi:L-ascorbate metabolism protein UlaG (beta-lactamase superfamily)|nr:MBL fold metallo-hydrolase [Candidatus Bathyarchaeota archaeon]
MSIDNTVPERNEIAFKWLGNYSGVTIRTPAGTLTIDPVDVSAKSFRNVDAVLVTHEHYDHLDELLIGKIHATTKCKILADPTSIRKLSNSMPSEDLHEMSPGREMEVGKIKVRAEMCNHPSAATPITFCLTSEDGVRVFHTADSLPFPEMREIGKTLEPDITFCTVGITQGASVKTGAEIVRLVKPRVAIPYHTPSKSDLTDFCHAVKKEFRKVKCLAPVSGNVYIVGKERRSESKLET